MDQSIGRRKLLVGTAVTAVSGPVLAGCVGPQDNDDEEPIDEDDEVPVEDEDEELTDEETDDANGEPVGYALSATND